MMSQINDNNVSLETNERLEDRIIELESQISNYQQILIVNNTDIGTLQEEIETLGTEIEKKNNSLSAAEEEKRILIEQVNSLERKEVETERVLNGYVNQISVISKDLDKSHNSFISMSSDFETTKKRLSKAEDLSRESSIELEKTKSLLIVANDTIIAKTEEVEDIRMQLRDAKAELKEKHLQYNDLETRRKEDEAQIAALSAHFDESKQVHSSAMNMQRTVLEDTQLTLVQQSETMRQLHTFIQTLQSENASYRSQLVDQEDLTSSLGEMAKLKLELMKCHNDLKEAQVEAEQKHIFSTSLLEQIKELHTNAMEYESTIQLLHNEREDEEL